MKDSILDPFGIFHSFRTVDLMGIQDPQPSLIEYQMCQFQWKILKETLGGLYIPSVNILINIIGIHVCILIQYRYK